MISKTKHIIKATQSMCRIKPRPQKSVEKWIPEIVFSEQIKIILTPQGGLQTQLLIHPMQQSMPLA